ncbi:MAG: response regulator [Micavibrio aeruginosavorus]|uniref:Response regulator n=1 Tax=Micavibrio aeruginosavorus TaxID=349221 RepID=A0A7T5R0V0_9BACT|nr:MAG: response regulator [Micavibrio aeruginosavorus]
MAYQMHKISVLVVEDNLPMLEITKSLLLTFGVGHVITAQNGEIGYKRFCETNPDIVIADWMMRPVDGISLTRMIRTDHRSPNPYVPVILMTGFSEKRRVFQARDAGVTEFLVKPFNARDLYKRLVQVIERPRQFVKAEDFFGPDRRRRSRGPYDGPMRRETDFSNPLSREALMAQQEEAQKNLARIREQSGLKKGDKFELNINPNDIDMV